MFKKEIKDFVIRFGKIFLYLLLYSAILIILVLIGDFIYGQIIT